MVSTPIWDVTTMTANYIPKGLSGAERPFDLAARCGAQRADLRLLYRLHKYLIEKCRIFVQYFSPKTLDKWARMWYNMSVKGRAERQSSKMRVQRLTAPDRQSAKARTD